MYISGQSIIPPAYGTKILRSNATGLSSVPIFIKQHLSIMWRSPPHCGAWLPASSQLAFSRHTVWPFYMKPFKTNSITTSGIISSSKHKTSTTRGERKGRKQRCPRPIRALWRICSCRRHRWVVKGAQELISKKPKNSRRSRLSVGRNRKIHHRILIYHPAQHVILLLPLRAHPLCPRGQWHTFSFQRTRVF